MSRSRKSFLIALFIAYVSIGFVTFGWTFNHQPVPTFCSFSDPSQCWNNDGAHQVSSLVSGALWPIFWAGKWAIEGTK